MSAPQTGPPRAEPRPGAGRSPFALPRWLRQPLRMALHLALDACAVALAYRAAYELRFNSAEVTAAFPITGIIPDWSLYHSLLYTIVPLWLLLFLYSSRLYSRSWPTPYDRGLAILQGAALSTLATLAASYIYGRLEYSRLMLVAAGPIAAAGVGLTQFLVLQADAALASLEAPSTLLLIGGGKVSQLVKDNIRARHPNAPIHELAHVPTPQELGRLLSQQEIHEAVLVRSDVEHKKLLDLAEACETAEIRFRMIPDLLELRLGEVQMDEFLGLPAYRLQHTQLTRANFLAKRAFDALFALGVLAALGIPLGTIALLIRLDSRGPALYRQKRLGFRGQTFDAFKFRTMVVDAESSLKSVRELNAQAGGFFKAKADPRVTRVGRFLRRFSLDEFPQFLNVLRGEMSIVGPRPLAVATREMEELLRQFGDTAKKRMNILPGITGLWQVSGRSDVSAEQRFALDMFYIEHWSLGLDLQIILKTIPAMLSGKGAY